MKLFRQWWESTGAHDDRGVAVRISQRKNPKRNDWLKAWLHPDDSTKRTLLGRIKQAIAVLSIVGMGVFFLLLVLMLVGQVFRLGPQTAARMTALMVVVGLLASAVFGLPMYLIARFAGIEKKKLVAIMGRRLAKLQCAQCEYDLSGTPIESDAPDSCTVCPECGAAWRLDLWTRDWFRRDFDKDTKFPGRWRVYPIDCGIRPLLIARPQRERLQTLSWAMLRQQLLPSWIELLVLSCLIALFILSGLSLQAWRAAFQTEQLFGIILFSFCLRSIWTTLAARNRVVRNQLENNLCPHCEHQLRAEPAHGDSAILCEHCGAAWSKALYDAALKRVVGGSSKGETRGATQ